jgi:alanine-synthesizing transaminase
VVITWMRVECCELKPIIKSNKLADVCYDIRGPVLDKARQMEEDGFKIIKLNIGNLAVFGR